MNSKGINELVFWFAITGWIINFITILGQVAYRTNSEALLLFFYTAFFCMGVAYIICFANVLCTVAMFVYVKDLRKEKQYVRNVILVSSSCIVYSLVHIQM